MDKKIKSVIRAMKITSCKLLDVMMESIEKKNDEKGLERLQEISDVLETEIYDSYYFAKNKAAVEGVTIGEFLQETKVVIDVLKEYQKLKDGFTCNTLTFKGLSDEVKVEIEEGLKCTKETGIAYHEDNPIIKDLMKRNKLHTNGFSNVKVVKSSDVIITKGNIGMYECEIMNNLAKCIREGNQVTSSGKGYLTIGQLYKWISGGVKKAPSNVQTQDLTTALKELSNKRIGYITSEDISNILGVEVSGYIGEFKAREADEQLLKCDFYKGTIRGQEATLIVFEFSRLIQGIMNRFSWYEPMPQEFKKIQYAADNGQLKTWTLTKQRIELRACIFNFVIAYIRARANGKIYSNYKPYNDIFLECEIDTTHRQTRQRKIKDIATILDHLQRIEVIAGWEEYTNRGNKKADGIRIFIDKELEN